MATGFPTKANWVSGEILTAAQMDDLAATLNLLSNALAASGSQLVSNAAGTSFAYQPTPSSSNPVLNSAFQIWQRYSTQVTGTITGATSGATTAYVVANSFVVGQYVTVTGMTPTTLNSAGVVTVASGTGFTISATTTGTFSAGGIATGSPYIAIPASQAYPSNFAADRWQMGTAGASEAMTISRQPTADTTNLPNIQYALRVQRNSGQTGTTAVNITQSFETVNSIPFAGKTVTLSFYARAGANYSGASSAFTGSLYTGSGTDQNLNPGGIPTVSVGTTVTLTTTWQRFQISGAIPSSVTQIGLAFGYTPVGTAGANDYYEMTGVQIDVGSVALPFRTNAGTLQGELAACQRYLPVVNTGTRLIGNSQSTTQTFPNIVFPVTARVAPTGITVGAVGNYAVINGSGTSGTPVAISFSSASVDGAQLGVTTTAGTPTLTIGQVGSLVAVTSTILFTGCEL